MTFGAAGLEDEHAARTRALAHQMELPYCDASDVLIEIVHARRGPMPIGRSDTNPPLVARARVCGEINGANNPRSGAGNGIASARAIARDRNVASDMSGVCQHICWMIAAVKPSVLVQTAGQRPIRRCQKLSTYRRRSRKRGRAAGHRHQTHLASELEDCEFHEDSAGLRRMVDHSPRQTKSKLSSGSDQSHRIQISDVEGRLFSAMRVRVARTEVSDTSGRG